MDQVSWPGDIDTHLDYIKIHQKVSFEATNIQFHRGKTFPFQYNWRIWGGESPLLYERIRIAIKALSILSFFIIVSCQRGETVCDKFIHRSNRVVHVG